MRYISKLAAFLFVIVVSLQGQQTVLHHSIRVQYTPDKSNLIVKDKITLPDNMDKETVYFYLHSGLDVKSTDPTVRVEKVDEGLLGPDVGMDRDIDEESSGVTLDKYRAIFPQYSPFILEVEYQGKIDHPIEQQGPEYARGFSQTPGIITDKGVYLAGSTYWVPWFNDDLFDFDMTVENPKGWKSVSQGKRTESKEVNDLREDHWIFPHPTEEVYLIAAPFSEYSYPAGAVTAMAFLRTPDENLANRYLETTAQYMEMYRQLIGPFPFSKFALVENFWETGYGMPSFTLLGEKVIRFPFILHSSYPHELLHNWWGNSVYVDFSKGNWCEGLTAYMADHLIKEQRGQGAEYRRSTLQKFTDYVNPENDFPVDKFINRYSASSEAIGYGKSLMMWHMLRVRFGDDIFVRAFQQFNRAFKYKKASFRDIQKIFEDLTAKDLSVFFDQWLTRTGAPSISIADAKVNKNDDQYQVKLTLEQIADKPYQLLVPVNIFTKNELISQKVDMTGMMSDYLFTTKSEPVKIEVDPEFDVFRKLDAFEIPPSLSKAFGSEKVMIVVGKDTDGIYKTVTDKWSSAEPGKFTVVDEAKLKDLPKDKSIWFLGTNPEAFAKYIRGYDVELNNDGLVFKTNSYDRKNHTVVLTPRHPQNPSSVLVWLSIDRADAVPGLLRKLPHYGKYSYLVFEGSDPTNIDKGQWPAIHSPMVRTFENVAVSESLPERKALATLPPVFNAQRMMETVQYLASDELKGRGIDRPEINTAADFIAKKFSEAGLQPLGDNGTYFQHFSYKTGKAQKTTDLKNIIGIIPGTNKAYAGQSVIISAHYDHLGLGWPDVYKGNEGKIHHGADDNASGVAVLLELAKVLGNSFKPERTVIFVAFTAEEAGLVGSRYYVKHPPKNYPLDKCMADLNLDTVGRLGNNKLLVLSSSSAKEWKFIFMGTGYVTGIESEMVMQPLDASDQVAFLEAGVPAVQFFSGAHMDYHKPTDTADKIDPDGLVKVATVSKEVLTYLTEREEMMTFTGETEKPKDHKPSTGSGRTATTGAMPDFAFSGSGVKLAAVPGDSPAALAGLKKDDILVEFGGVKLSNLREYSNELAKYKPGDEVEVTVKRGDEIKHYKVKLKAR